MNRLSGHGSVGMIANKFSLEGPIKKGKHSFFMAGRRSHVNEYLRFAGVSKQDRKNIVFGFSDFNLKTNFRINNDNRLYLSAYIGNDEYSTLVSSQTKTSEQADSTIWYKKGIGWRNIAGTIRWNHIFNKKLFSNTTLYSSSYNYYLFANQGVWTSFVGSGAIKTDFTWYRKPENKIKFGALFDNHFFDPGTFNKAAEQSIYVIPKEIQYRTQSVSMYISNEQKLNKKISFK